MTTTTGTNPTGRAGSGADTYVEREIHRQPEAWSRAAELLPGVSALLPQPGERVAVIGCGTSWFMALAYAALRDDAGDGPTDAFAASLVPDRDYDRVVAITRSGTTTEVLRAIERISVPAVALTAVADSPVVAAASESIVLDFADEQSVVQTVFATTALNLLRASLGEDLEPIVEQARSVLGSVAALPAQHASQITFLGSGWAYGIALEAGLKMREAAQAWTEAYPAMEYRHGPVAIAEPGRATWLFGATPPGLATEVAATGAEFVDDDLDPVADLIRAQLLAVERATMAGLDPDRPRHLTRSVVLDER